jgi:molecular chaperone DnaJ
VAEECGSCTGRGVVRERKSVKVDFPPGIDDGMTLRVMGEGNAAEMGATGHLLVKVKVRVRAYRAPPHA